MTNSIAFGIATFSCTCLENEEYNLCIYQTWSFKQQKVQFDTLDINEQSLPCVALVEQGGRCALGTVAGTAAATAAELMLSMRVRLMSRQAHSSSSESSRMSGSGSVSPSAWMTRRYLVAATTFTP